METPKGRSSLENQGSSSLETTAAASMVTPPEHNSNHLFASTSAIPKSVPEEESDHTSNGPQNQQQQQKNQQTPIRWVNSKDENDDNEEIDAKNNGNAILSSKRGGRLRSTPIVSKANALRRSDDAAIKMKEDKPEVLENEASSNNNSNIIRKVEHPSVVVPKEVEAKSTSTASSRNNASKDQRKSPLLEKCTTPTNEDVYYNNNRDAASLAPKNPDDPHATAMTTTTTTFDTSNVLAWLQSPTAMFSPGCFADDSMLNTPKTPLLAASQKLDATSATAGSSRNMLLQTTPTVSTSFFFSDVASLKASSSQPTYSTPRFVSTSNTASSDVAAPPNSAHRQSNIICISPLATTRKSGSGVTTPMDLKEIFASPAERRKFHISSSSALGGRATQDIDAYNTDVMEDEDLSVLLQLAAKSNNSTPLGFRSPSLLKRRSRPEDDDELGRPADDDDLLQLPMIRSNQRPSSFVSARRLMQKSESSSEAAENDFCPPHPQQHHPLSRSGSGHSTLPLSATTNNHSSSQKKEIYVSSSEKETGKKKGTSSTTYHHPLLYPSSMPPEHLMSSHGPPYYPPGAGGSMSITVGGKSKGGGTPPRHFPDYGSYAMYGPAYMGYPPHSMYPPPGVPPNAASVYPPPHMYGAATAPSYKMPRKGETRGKAGMNEAGSDSKKRPSLSNAMMEDSSDRDVHAVAVPSSNLSAKKAKKTVTPPAGSSSKKKKVTTASVPPSVDRQKAADMIQNLNAAAGGKNDKAAALAAAILRGVTMRPSGKWQAQLYFAGKSRYIGVFDTREKAALAYEIAREKLKSGHVSASSNSPPPTGGESSMTENLVNLARKAAFDGVSETFLNSSGTPDASPTATVKSS
jgi:AP2 domain